MMKFIGKFQFTVTIFILITLFFSSVSPVFSQGSQSITATGHIWRPEASEFYNMPFTLVFSPAGGMCAGQSIGIKISQMQMAVQNR